MIIAIVNQKGGTGKTTTTVNLGSALAQAGKRVLLIDLDPQGNLGYSLGIDADQTIADVFTDNVQIKDIVQEAEGMDVVASDVSLADVELSMVGEEEREGFLKKHMGNPNYDFVLIDCPPSLSLLTINALTAAQGVIIPMQMEVLSLQGLELITTTISKVRDSLNPLLEVLGVLPIMFDKRRKLSLEVYEHIRDNYNLHMFARKIRTNVKASEAPSFGKSVISYDPLSNSARDYLAFSKELIELVNNK